MEYTDIERSEKSKHPSHAMQPIKKPQIARNTSCTIVRRKMTGYISLTPPLGTRSPSDRDMSRICCFTVQVPNRLTVARFRLAPIRRLPYDQTQLEAMLEAIQA